MGFSWHFVSNIFEKMQVFVINNHVFSNCFHEMSFWKSQRKNLRKNWFSSSAGCRTFSRRHWLRFALAASSVDQRRHRRHRERQVAFSVGCWRAFDRVAAVLLKVICEGHLQRVPDVNRLGLIENLTRWKIAFCIGIAEFKLSEWIL